ncbi:MAG: aldo/keto reductase [Bacteroidota bacterium]
MAISSPLTLQSTVTLNNGVEIPVLGLGVFRAPADPITVDAILAAFAVGYRHIDTAMIYRNEAQVGRAIRESGGQRDEIFLTTKLWNSDHGYDATLRAIDGSLERLGVEQVDLYLVHYPVFGPRLETWKAMERILESGRARAIGVSNYMPRHLNELLANCNVPPAVNQLELSPYIFGYRKEIVELCRAKNIVLEAYSPLTKARKLDDPPLIEIANQYGKTTAQILIRWALQEGFVVLPKSTNPGRIQQNSEVFDFEIRPEDMVKLAALNEDLVTGWDPTDAP